MFRMFILLSSRICLAATQEGAHGRETLQMPRLSLRNCPKISFTRSQDQPTHGRKTIQMFRMPVCLSWQVLSCDPQKDTFGGKAVQLHGLWVHECSETRLYPTHEDPLWSKTLQMLRVLLLGRPEIWSGNPPTNTHRQKAVQVHGMSLFCVPESNSCQSHEISFLGECLQVSRVFLFCRWESQSGCSYEGSSQAWFVRWSVAECWRNGGFIC